MKRSFLSAPEGYEQSVSPLTRVPRRRMPQRTSNRERASTGADSLRNPVIGSIVHHLDHLAHERVHFARPPLAGKDAVMPYGCLQMVLFEVDANSGT